MIPVQGTLLAPLITINDLHAGYGNAQVLFGVNLYITAGQVSTLMCRNGMGKTTTVRCLPLSKC